MWLRERSVSSNTLSTYRTGIVCWEKFCNWHSLCPYPASEHNLCLFIAYLSFHQYGSSTANTYLAAICYAHNLLGLSLNCSSMPILQRTLSGLRHTSPPTSSRLPITIPILHLLHQYFARSPLSLFDQHCIWSCCSLAFFGCFRIGEILPTPARNHILTCDILLQPEMLQLHLRRSKTDKFADGTTIQLQPINSPLCPVKALLSYLPHRLARFPGGPIFILNSGEPLTPCRFNSTIKSAVSHLGLDPSRFSSHSFRSGAATSAATAGLPDWLIKAMGRWASDAYHLYIKTPPAALSNIPTLLCNAS